MWTDRVSNPGPLTYESGALPTALRGPAIPVELIDINPHTKFQVATIVGTLRSTSYNNLNPILTGSCT